MKLAIPIAVVGAIAVVAGATIGIWVSNPKSDSTGPGIPFARAVKAKQLPELQFKDGAGRSHTLADFGGKLVLLNLWATWCAPCREEMPALDRLQATLGGRDFEVVALSIDQQGAEVGRKFFDEIGIKALKLYVDSSAQAAFKLGAVGLPSTLLVDGSGREIGRHTGPAKWDAPEIVEDLRRRMSDGKKS